MKMKVVDLFSEKIVVTGEIIIMGQKGGFGNRNVPTSLLRLLTLIESVGDRRIVQKQTGRSSDQFN